MFIAPAACEARNDSKASCAIPSARKSKLKRSMSGHGISNKQKVVDGNARPPDFSDEMRCLRAWLDVTVVQRLAHMESMLVSIQTGNKLDIGSTTGSMSQMGSREATTKNLAVFPSCGSRSLQMPSGDYSIDMDCNIPGAKQDHLWAPSHKKPNAGPPGSLLEDFRPLKGEGSDSNGTTQSTCYNSNQSASLQVPSADDSNYTDREPPLEIKPDSGRDFAPVGSLNSTGSIARRPSVTSIEDQEKLMEKMKSHQAQGWSFREAAWAFVEDPESSRSASIYQRGMIGFALIAVVMSVVQALESPPLSGAAAFAVESIFEWVFLIEFIFRLSVCPERKTFASNMHNIFDLTAAMPLFLRIYVFLSGGYTIDAGSIASSALIGVVPMLRVLKTLRGFQQFQLLLSALELCIEALPICLFAFMALSLTFGAMIFMVEPRDNITSFPHAMWLTIVTMTTLGYGDVMPTTTIGYMVISVIVVCSVLFMAMPLGIIGQAFTTVWQDRDRILLVCCFRAHLQQWGYKPTDIPMLFEWFDDDGDGELQFSEFKHMIEEMHIGLSDIRIVQLFGSIDTDGGGSIDAREFVKALFPQYYEQIFGGTWVSEDGKESD